MPETGIENGRLVLFANPTSSQPERVKRFEEALEDCPRFSQDMLLVHTQPPWEADNAELLASELREGDIVVVLGGDGTTNAAANGIIKAEQQNVKMVSASCGNADDISQSLYGEGFFGNEANIFQVLEHGEQRPLSTIRVDQGGTTRHALGYFGLGLTGMSAERMNIPGYRRMKEGMWPWATRLTDAGIVAPLLLPRAKNGFRYSMNGDIPVARRELLISNVNRFAREFRIDVDPWANEAVVNEFTPERFLSGILGRLYREQLRGEGLIGTPLTERIVELHSDTALQYDGEPVRAPAGTVLGISTAPNTINGLWVPGG